MGRTRRRGFDHNRRSQPQAQGETIDPETHKAIYSAIRAGYTEQADIRHGAARGWLDRIIDPTERGMN